nr:type II toxin-antitoxin system HipA family toxin [Variovorax terrae]
MASHSDAAVTPAGLLKLARQGVMESGEFAYGRHYLQDGSAQALNPGYLPLQEAVFSLPGRRLRDGGALPLTFRDALPDAWGRRVLEAQHGRELSDPDVLLLTNEDRIGAMVFAEGLPIEPQAPATELFELQALAEAARQLEAGKEPDRAMKRLLQGGGSLGGARPKASFVHEGRRCIAKFPSRGDEHPVEILEAATLGLAMQCGIEVPPFFLQPLRRGQALVLRRFDREGPIDAERRHHYLSAAAVLNVRYESSDGSYVELAQAIRQWCAAPLPDLRQLYRRMVFNLVADNSDDHVKNHGVLLQANGRYRLAPAFDLVMQLTNLGYQALAILPGRLEAHLDLAREAAPQFGLPAAEAEAIIEQVSDTVHLQAALMLQAHGADAALISHVRACLDKQARLIGL